MTHPRPKGTHTLPTNNKTNNKRIKLGRESVTIKAGTYMRTLGPGHYARQCQAAAVAGRSTYSARPQGFNCQATRVAWDLNLLVMAPLPPTQSPPLPPPSRPQNVPRSTLSQSRCPSPAESQTPRNHSVALHDSTQNAKRCLRIRRSIEEARQHLRRHAPTQPPPPAVAAGHPCCRGCLPVACSPY